MAYAQSHNIKNDTFWDTVDGEPIYSQGGGSFAFTDPNTNDEKYYWCGVRYEEAESYRQDPSVTFQSQKSFSLRDLLQQGPSKAPAGRQRNSNVQQFVISVVPIGTLKLQSAHRSGCDHARKWAVVPIGTFESRTPPLRNSPGNCRCKIKSNLRTNVWPNESLELPLRERR
jgi:hypothetical protein